MESPPPNFQNLSELWHVCLHNVCKFSLLLHFLLVISFLSLKHNFCDWSLNSTRKFSSHSYLLIAIGTGYELLVYSYKLQKQCLQESNGSKIISEVLSKTPSFPCNFFFFHRYRKQWSKQFHQRGFLCIFLLDFLFTGFLSYKETRKWQS